MSKLSDLHDAVIARDGSCMGRKAEIALDQGETHQCGPWLTLEHVTMVHTITEGRISDLQHCVTLCANLNGRTIRLAPHWMKEWFRGELRKMYPDAHKGS